MERAEIMEKLNNIIFPHNKVKFLADNNIEDVVICNAFDPDVFPDMMLAGSRDSLAMIRHNETGHSLYRNERLMDNINFSKAQWTDEFSPKEWINKFFPYEKKKKIKKKSLFGL